MSASESTKSAASSAVGRGAWARSLRFRLTAWYTAVLGLFLATAAALLYGGVYYTLVADTDSFLRVEERRLATAALDEPHDLSERTGLSDAVTGRPHHHDDDDHSPELPKDSLATRGLLHYDVVYQRYVDAQTNRMIAASPELLRDPDLVGSLDRLLDPGVWRHNVSSDTDGSWFAYAGPDEERTMRILSAPVRTIYGTTLFVQVAVPWDHNADVLERLGLLLTVIVPAILVPVAIGSWALVGGTLGPIRRIVAEADQLDATDIPDAFITGASESDTEIGQLTTTLNRMITRLRKAFAAQRRFGEAQQRFAADASHELRTPLAILRGEMELALTRPRSPDLYRATLASSLEEIERMSRIVEGLSLLARGDTLPGKVQAPRPAVDIVAIATATVEECVPVARDRGIDLRLAASDSIRVPGNADQLQLVLRNLLENAVKFTSAGGSVRVAVELVSGDPIDSADTVCRILVADTGVGISADDLPHVFERFWRADRSRSTLGTGLGLAIAYQIAEAHGGSLNVTSEVGVGSTFVLEIPAEAASRNEPPAA